MSGPDRRHAAAVARRVERALGPRGHPPVLAAALLHDVGKVESGLGTYGRVVATLSGQGRRPRHGHAVAAASVASPAGSASTSGTTTRRATCSSWPAATRSPSPGPASTTSRRTQWTLPPDVAAALKAADDD